MIFTILDDKRTKHLLFTADSFLAGTSFILCGLWVLNVRPLYSESHPVLSPLTCFSLGLLSTSRIALKYLDAFPALLTLAILFLVIGGNLSSIMVMTTQPDLLRSAFPQLVGSSIATSCGIVMFCSYEALLIFRKTPKQGFIIDDILLHLAIVPGAVNLLGHVLTKPIYIHSYVDPRIGISFLEIGLMSINLFVAAVGNRELFLWHFLHKNKANFLIFSLLFLHQYTLPVVVGFMVANPDPHSIGIELYVMIAGILSTLIFLIINAIYEEKTCGSI